MNRWLHARVGTLLLTLGVVLLGLPQVAHGIAFSDSDIHNAARRMTSLTEHIHETRKRMESAPFFETDLKVFAAVLQARGDMIPDLPIVLDSGIESMQLIRGYTEVTLQISDEKRSWTAAFTAAGLAYGLNREYDVDASSFTGARPLAFDEAGSRAGGDAHGDQFMDAAYLLHGKAGEFRYEVGFLQSSVIQPEIGTMVLDSEREITGRWVTGNLDWRDIKVGLRADTQGESGLDFFTFDWNLLSSLHKFNVGDGTLGSPKLPEVKLLLEYTKFAQVADEVVGGAGAIIGYAEDRGDDFLMGFNIKQDFVALWRDGPPEDIVEHGGFEEFWIDTQGHYGLTSGVFRDAMIRGGTTLWFPPTKKGHLVALQLHGGYSNFTDEEALPFVLGDLEQTSVTGTLFRTAFKMRLKNKKTGKFFPPIFHIIGEFRSNWAPDLARVVEFANTPIFHVGLAMTYGL